MNIQLILSGVDERLSLKLNYSSLSSIPRMLTSTIQNFKSYFLKQDKFSVSNLYVFLEVRLKRTSSTQLMTSNHKEI